MGPVVKVILSSKNFLAFAGSTGRNCVFIIDVPFLSYFARISEFASEDCRCFSRVVGSRGDERQMEIPRSGACWNVGLSASGFGFALAQFGVFSRAKNFWDHWDCFVF